MTFHMEGFEQFVAEPNIRTALGRAGYKLDLGTPVVVHVRDGAGVAFERSAHMSREHAWGGSRFATGCGLSFTDRTSMLAIEFDDDEWLVAWLHPGDAMPRMGDGVGGTIPIINRWYFVEIELDRAAGTATLFINNREDVVATLTPTQLAATEVRVHIGQVPTELYFEPEEPEEGEEPLTMSNDAVINYADWYMKDGTRFGPVEVRTRWATGLTGTTWFAFGDDTLAILRALPPNPRDKYVGAHEAGLQIDLSSATALSNENEVVATGMVLLTRKADNSDLGVRAYIGGAEDGAALRQKTVEPGTAWTMQYITFYADSGDTPENIETAPFGVTSVIV